MSVGVLNNFICKTCGKKVSLKINQSGEPEDLEQQEKIFCIADKALNELKAIHGENCIFKAKEGAKE